MNLAMIFIAHDLAVVRRLCDRVAVMYLGRIVEEGRDGRCLRAPRHPYTQALIRAIPEIDPDKALPAETARRRAAEPARLPPGCAFHPRCPTVMAACRADPAPALRMAGSAGASLVGFLTR